MSAVRRASQHPFLQGQSARDLRIGGLWLGAPRPRASGEPRKAPPGNSGELRTILESSRELRRGPRSSGEYWK
eukprot:14700062-Alexandrium_andersonii.AAC.1